VLLQQSGGGGGTHLQTEGGEMSRGMEEKRLSNKHSQARDWRGRDESGHRSKQATGTHPLETMEGWTYWDKEWK